MFGFGLNIPCSTVHQVLADDIARKRKTTDAAFAAAFAEFVQGLADDGLLEGVEVFGLDE